MDSHVPCDRDEPWTDEKHLNFLNSMETWFVRTMLENNGRYHLRLDRHLPDSSESTLDCKQNHIHTRKKHATSGSPAVDFMGRRRNKVKGGPNKRSRRSSSKPYYSSQDQVVPQIENITGDKDEKELPNMPVASIAPAN